MIDDDRKHATTCRASQNPIFLCQCDGYHTFDELYAHRITLYIALCKLLVQDGHPETVWRSRKHSDGSQWGNWFILGINTMAKTQITYHISDMYWDTCDFAVTLEKAPKFDGHTSLDVIKRLKTIFDIKEKL